MNAFGEAVGAMSQGIDFLAGFDRDVAVDAGFPPHQVRAWAKAREVYFGATRWSMVRAVVLPFGAVLGARVIAVARGADNTKE